MPSTRDIRRRIKSVKGTRQITKAMQMVASSKMQKAQQAALAGRPFAAMAQRLMDHMAESGMDYRHPLMEKREGKRKAIVLVGTDKGLCGALNSNLFREASHFDADTQFIAVGRKAAQFLARTKRKLVAEFLYRDIPTYSECEAISHAAQELFAKGEVDSVEVLYTQFINTLSQKPKLEPLLPVADINALRTKEEQAAAEKPKEQGQGYDYIFEPSPKALMERLMVYFIDFRVAQILLEAKASEHSARMVAMKNATDNAKDLIDDLTLEYNKIRQASITKELLEITSAAMAAG